jgi:alpha-beta hydrolase superfamily lysophospholipase
VEVDILKHEEMNWLSNDALNLFAQSWEPEGEAKGAIALIHGLGEHSGRYRHWVEKLCEAGYAVESFDLRGHGRSEGQRGHTPSFDHYADDVDILINHTRNRFVDKPLFIYGHSLGGLIVLFYLIQRQPDLSGAVVTNPGLRTALGEQKMKVILARLLGSLMPAGSMSSGLEQEALARDHAVIEAYRNDPLVHDKVSFGFGKQSLAAIDYIFNNADRINLPLLLMHGTADRIAFVSGPEELASRVPDNCTLKIWEGFFHELHNEPEKDAVFAFLKEWLDGIVQQ